MTRWAQVVAGLCAAVPGVARPDAFALPDAGALSTAVDAGAAYEWAALPVIDGNTDIGVEFGGFAVITRVAPPGAPIPYLWSLKVAPSVSVKAKPGGGVELPVHDDSVEFDWRSVDGRFKWLSDVWFWRSAVAGFYGLGNLSPPTGDPASKSLRSAEYVRSEFVAQSALAWEVVKSWNVRACLLGQRFSAVAYPGSTLDLQRNTEPLLLGVDTHVALIGTVGVEFDTRDNEIATNRGVYLSGSVRGSPGPLTGNDLSFGAVNLHARGYYDVWPGRVVLAARVLFDGAFGRPPLQELSHSGGFDSVWMLGGSDGVRGMPEGRYQGRVRVNANLEARVNVVSFTLFEQRIGIGVVAFGDGGRVWADWRPRPDLDGTGAGLHLAVGGGVRLRIGDTILFRLDAAWSPPPVNPPDDQVGVYVDYGHVF